MKQKIISFSQEIRYYIHYPFFGLSFIMLDLTLDTSTDPYFIVLSKESKILGSKLLPQQHNLSSALLPVIEKLLEETSHTLKDLSSIFVGTGPGSYTGIRIAVSVANSLALALDIPVYPFCSLLAFIPPTIPDGPFSFIAHSSNSDILILQGKIKNKELSTPSTQLLKEKTFLSQIPAPPLVTLSPENTLKKWDLKTLEGTLNLPLLLSYLASLKLSPPEPPNIYYLHQF